MPASRLVGIVSPGAMGSALGRTLRGGGSRVVVSLDGRSERSRRLATEAGLEDVGSLDVLLREAAVVLSVVPPGSALEVAEAIAANAQTAMPLVADLNAVAPATAERIATTLREAGLDMVDGSISGPPPREAGTTRVYLSGPRAAEVAALPLDGVQRVVVGDDVGLASAVKMCTASVYKGRVALLAQALRTAHAHGVVEHVLDDLAEAGLADPERTGATLARASAKAWRYVAEMEEIAQTQDAAGLRKDLFAALAIVYGDLAAAAADGVPEEALETVSLDAVLDRFAAARTVPDGVT
jgi:3-hydroxyisobutyrate dehydrogenase-like beta-hydroxyacid dehydrogenase